MPSVINLEDLKGMKSITANREGNIAKIKEALQFGNKLLFGKFSFG
jgi:hypothetical protein